CPVSGDVRKRSWGGFLCARGVVGDGERVAGDGDGGRPVRADGSRAGNPTALAPRRDGRGSGGGSPGAATGPAGGGGGVRRVWRWPEALISVFFSARYLPAVGLVLPLAVAQLVRGVTGIF